MSPDLRARLFSGIPAVLVILVPLGWGNFWGVYLLAAVAMVWGLHEMATMGLPEERRWAFPLMLAFGVPLFTLVALASRDSIPGTDIALQRPGLLILSTFVGAVVLSAVAFLFTARSTEGLADRWARFLLALLYVPLLLGVLPGLVGFDGGSGWVWVPLFIGWCGDIGGYFAGRAFGKHKMLPLISPKKTWEGFAGGVALAVFGVAFYKVVFFDRMATSTAPLTWLDCLVLGVIGDLAGVVGDLVESMIKRTWGVKDSGRFLPGHGGMLDRIDAVMFVAPVVYTWAVVVKPLLAG